MTTGGQFETILQGTRTARKQLEEHTRAGHHIIERVMAVNPIHAQRFKEIAERMALEFRAKVTGQRQRIAHYDTIWFKRAIEFVVDYAQELGNANAKNFTFIPCPLFFNDSQQHLEWQEMRKGNRPALYELSKNLNIRFFVLQNEIEEP